MVECLLSALLQPYRSRILRDAQDFFDGGFATQGLGQPVLVHGAHAGLAGQLFDFAHAGTAHHRTAQFVVHHQEFDDGGASKIPGRCGGRGTRAIQKDVALRLQAAQIELGDFFRRSRIALGIGQVEFAHQTLRQDAVDGGGEQIILHAHVEQTGDAAGRVIGVQRGQHQVAGERGLDRDACGFQIAHFADHDDVRILTHDAAQCVGEIQPDLRLGLDLVDAFDLVFHRVFDGDDFHIRGVELAQRGVQRGGLARTGGPGHQHGAVRLLQHLAELRQEVFGEAELVEVEHHRLAIEQAHDHAFAMRSGHGADAQIQLLALHAQHDAAVLRQAALGDVELGHDLDAADDRSSELGRRAFAFHQHAVHAVTHLEAAFERFDMDVGGAQFHRVLDHQVHQPDHRRFGGQIAQRFDVVATVGIAIGGFDDGAHRTAALAVPALDQVIDFRTQAHLQQQRAAGGKTHCIDGVIVVRIGDPQLQPAIALADRTQMKLFEKTQRQPLHFGQHFRRRIAELACVHQRQAKDVGAGFCMIAFGHQTQTAEQGEQPHAGFGLQLARAQQIGVFQTTAFKQRIDDARLRTSMLDWIDGNRVHTRLHWSGADCSSLPRRSTARI
ncbi:conserved hypothetical protein [Xanthomonas citri pv. citri]|nr:conserved hypothetical protein [Xanthomonas citri pv. citri]